MHMQQALEPSLRAEAAETVAAHNTAAAVGSGSLPVYATPAMIALMEKASCAAIEAGLAPGQTSVGTALSVCHSAATPVGKQVRATAELTAVEGRKLTFRVEAFDESGKIGEGTHTRCIVDAERFVKKAQEK